jgi:hypothetical protein
VPVHTGGLEGAVVVLAHLAPQGLDVGQDEAETADDHVQTVEAHDGEEGGGPEVLLPGGVVVEVVELPGLEEEEEDPQDDGDEKPKAEGVEAAPPQVVVGEVHGEGGAHQEEGVEEGEPQGRPFSRGHCVAGEAEVEVAGDQDGEKAHLGDDEPGHPHPGVGLAGDGVVLHRVAVLVLEGPADEAIGEEGQEDPHPDVGHRQGRHAHEEGEEGGGRVEGPEGAVGEVDVARVLRLQLHPLLLPVVKGPLGGEVGGELHVKVVGLGRGVGEPLQGVAAPGVGGSLLPGAQALPHVVDPDQAAQPQDEGPDGGDQVQLGPAGDVGVVGVVAPGHAQVAQDVLGQEGEEVAHQEEPEVEPAQAVVVHAARHLGPPVVKPSKGPKARSRHEDVVEVGHHEVGVLEVVVQGGHGEHDPGNPPEEEVEDEAQHPVEGGLHLQVPGPEGADDVEKLHPRGNSDEGGEEGEGDLEDGALPHGEHVVGPDHGPQDHDAHLGPDHLLVTKKGLTGEGGGHLGQDPQVGQEHHVDRGVGVEPEELLEENRIPADLRIEPGEADLPVQEDEEGGRGEPCQAEEVEDAGGEDAPDVDGHLPEAHPLGPEVIDGGDEVGVAQEAGEAQEEDGRHVKAHPAPRLHREGIVEGPAYAGSPAGEEVAHEGEEDGPQKGPVAEGVHPGQGHVPGPQHQGHHEVAEAREPRLDDEEEEHGGPVQGEDLVVLLPGEEVVVGHRELGADEEGEDPRQGEGEEGGGGVQKADLLVVYGGEKVPKDRPETGFWLGGNGHPYLLELGQGLEVQALHLKPLQVTDQGIQVSFGQLGEARHLHPRLHAGGVFDPGLQVLRGVVHDASGQAHAVAHEAQLGADDRRGHLALDPVAGHAVLLEDLLAPGVGHGGRVGPGRLHEAVKLLLGHHQDPEEHAGVAGAAELGAEAVVVPDFLRGEVNQSLLSRNGVPLARKPRHPEGVDHVLGGNLQLHGKIIQNS